MDSEADRRTLQARESAENRAGAALTNQLDRGARSKARSSGRDRLESTTQTREQVRRPKHHLRGKGIARRRGRRDREVANSIARRHHPSDPSDSPTAGASHRLKRAVTVVGTRDNPCACLAQHPPSAPRTPTTRLGAAAGTGWIPNVSAAVHGRARAGQLGRGRDVAPARGGQGAGPADLALVMDLDSFIGEVHGYENQPTGYGYTHRCGYDPILATQADIADVLHIRNNNGQATTQRGPSSSNAPLGETGLAPAARLLRPACR